MQKVVLAALLGNPERPLRVKSHNWETILQQPESEWKENFRLGHVVFNAVRDQLATLPIFQVPGNVGTRAVDVAKQLAIFLYRFGHGDKSCRSIAHFFDCGMQTVRDVSMRVAQALPEAFPDIVYLERDGPQKAKEMEAFEDKGWKGCRGIIDVTHIKVVPEAAARRGGYSDVYMNRTGEFAKAYQFTVAADLRVLNVYGGHGAKTSDQTILNESQIYANIGELLGDREYFMADMGYALRPWCISGFRINEIIGQPNADGRTLFNRRFSGTRITVERSIGVLKARFRSLLVGLCFRDPTEYSRVVLALCILHNICIEHRDSWDRAEILAAFEEERRQKAARRRHHIQLVRDGQAPPPVIHADTLAAGRVRRAEIAAGVGTIV